VLTHHGQKIQFGIRVLAFPIAFYSDPLYLSALGQLLLTYERYIVLGLASSHTGFATRAGIQVNCHRPVIVEFIVVAWLSVLTPTIHKS
jgi:hypothetical protein